MTRYYWRKPNGSPQDCCYLRYGPPMVPELSLLRLPHAIHSGGSYSEHGLLNTYLHLRCRAAAGTAIELLQRLHRIFTVASTMYLP